MINSEIKELVKSKSLPGLKGLFKVYFNKINIKYVTKVIWKGYKFPLILSFILIIIYLIFCDISLTYNYLNVVNNRVMSILPNLLGFTLGGYTLFVAFGGENFIKRIIYYRKDDKYSLYQMNSAVFAISLLFQTIFLLIVFFISIILDIGIFLNYRWLNNVVNIFVLWFLFFGMFGSVYVLRDIIINIFNLSQQYHFSLWKNGDTHDGNNINGNIVPPPPPPQPK